MWALAAAAAGPGALRRSRSCWPSRSSRWAWSASSTSRRSTAASCTWTSPIPSGTPLATTRDTLVKVEETVDGIPDLRAESAMAGAYLRQLQRLHRQWGGRPARRLPHGRSRALDRLLGAAAAGAGGPPRSARHGGRGPRHRDLGRQHTADRRGRLEPGRRTRAVRGQGRADARADGRRDRRPRHRRPRRRRRSPSSSTATAPARSTRASAPRRPRSGPRSAATSPRSSPARTASRTCW